VCQQTTSDTTVLMLIKHMIQFSTRNSVVRIYGWSYGTLFESSGLMDIRTIMLHFRIVQITESNVLIKS